MQVVELSTSDVLQSSTLKFFLKTAHSNSFSYTEFVRHNYVGLLGPVIRSENCTKSVRLLNSVLETACSGPIISKGPDGFEISTAKNVCVIYADLIVGVLNHYSDWHTKGSEIADIIEVLLNVIHALVSEKHTFQSLNIARFNKAKLLPTLFNFCKIYLTSGAQQIHWNQSAAESMVNIIRIFAGAPPNPALLDDIVKVLLMIHRPSNSYITHDRSKFYFLLSPTQQKTRRTGLPLTMKSTGMKKSTMLQRSTSCDNGIEKGGSSSSNRSNSGSKNSSQEIILEMTALGQSDESSVKPEVNGKKSPSITSEDSLSNSNHSRAEHQISVLLNANDKAKFERALVQLNTKRHTSNNKRLRKIRTRGKYQRQRSITESESSEREKKSKRRKKRSVSDSGIDLALFREYDIIADEEVKRISSALSLSEKDDKIATIISHEVPLGIIYLQNGLLQLLHDFILILPDTAVEEVLSHYVTMEIVLILANNEVASVRASIVKLLSVMCDRSSNIPKAVHLFHLGNQIALYPAEHSLVQSCVQWVTGLFQSIDQLVHSNSVKVIHKLGINALIAILPQTIHDVTLAKCLFQLMILLYRRSDADSCAYMIEVGLLPAAIKSLTRAYVKWGTENDNLIHYIEQLLCTIAIKSLSTAGSINVLWDLLNGITFVEQSKNGPVYRGIRSSQASVLLFLIKSFFSKYKNPSQWSFKLAMSDIVLNDCSLSSAEKRTRLELLLDRTVQFVRTANTTHLLTQQEMNLIEALVIISMTGFSRGSSIIPWCFLPNNPMPLKYTIIKLIWKHVKNSELPATVCDPKLVKTMIHSFWLTDRDVIPSDYLETLQKVCRALGIQLSTTNCNVSQAIVKMDLARENIVKERKQAIDRSVYKFDSVALNCIDTAMKTTRYIVEIQNAERRNTIASTRIHDESYLLERWSKIVDRMTHEGAPWYSPKNSSK